MLVAFSERAACRRGSCDERLDQEPQLRPRVTRRAVGDARSEGEQGNEPDDVGHREHVHGPRMVSEESQNLPRVGFLLWMVFLAVAGIRMLRGAK